MCGEDFKKVQTAIDIASNCTQSSLNLNRSFERGRDDPRLKIGEGLRRMNEGSIDDNEYEGNE